ncbi:MAG: DUF4240 domain-containing protein [Terracoccus sp.]
MTPPLVSARARVALTAAVLVSVVAVALGACGPPTEPASSGAGSRSTTTAPPTAPSGSPSPDPSSVKERMMPEAEFWSIVDGTASADVEAQAVAIDQRLEGLSASELLGYEQRFVELANRSNTFVHLGAAEVVMGYASQDAFVDFRTWVLYQGSAVYTAFVNDPDSLAAHGPSDDEQLGGAQLLEFVPAQRFTSLTGAEPPEPNGPTVYQPPTGPTIDNTYLALAARFPQLAAAYLPDPPPTGSPQTGGPRSITRR